MAGGFDPRLTEGWLPRLPEQWVVDRLGSRSWIRARLGWRGLTADEYVDSGVPMFSTPDIKGPNLNFEGCNRVTVERYDESPEIKLRLGDVLLTKDGATIGITNVVTELPEPATVNGSIAVITPDSSLEPRFLRYSLASSYGQQVMTLLQGGMGVPHLFQSDIKRITIPIPPWSVQIAIADFLDRETAKIDALVDRHQDLAVALGERLDSIWNAMYRECSGSLVMVTRLIDSIVDGPFGSSLTSAHYADTGTRVIRLGNIGIGEFRDADEAYVPEEYARQLSAHAARAGDVVMAGLGDERMPLGRAAVVPDSLGPAIVKADCYRLTPRSRLVTPDFLAWALSSPPARAQIALLARGATRARLNTGIAKSVQVKAPPLAEQQQVTQEWRQRCSDIQIVIRRAIKAVAIARERRSALITAAVTGQLDIAGKAG